MGGAGRSGAGDRTPSGQVAVVGCPAETRAEHTRFLRAFFSSLFLSLEARGYYIGGRLPRVAGLGHVEGGAVAV